MLRPALHGSQREKRPRQLEGVHSLRRLRRLGRRLERGDRPLAIALRVEEKSAAAEDERAQSDVTVSRASIDQREQPFRPANVAGRKQSLDSSRARQLGEVPVELLDVVEKRRCVPIARGGIVRGELEDCECDPQAKDLPSEPACLDDLEQFGDRSARALGLTPVGVDLGENRQAKRLEHLQPDLPRKLDRLVAQLRRRVPCARCHLRLGSVEQAPDNVGVGPLCGLGSQLLPEGARFVVAVGPAEQKRERDARGRQAHRQTGVPGPAAGSRVAVAVKGLLQLARTIEKVMADATGARERALRDR